MITGISLQAAFFMFPYASVFLLVVMGVLGLVFGSFINCWAWRFCNGESVMNGHSHCTSCGHELGFFDLIPLFSWLFSRGRCRYCHEKVSVRYPITEFVCCVVFLATTVVYGFSITTVELCLFSCVLLFISLTDIDSYTIPNKAIIAAIIIRALYIAAMFALGFMSLETLGYYVASAFGVGLALLAIVLIGDKIAGRATMGGGDIKLLFVAALYFGWQKTLLLLFASCVIGIAVAAISNSMHKGAKAEDAADENPDADESEEKAEEPLMSREIPFGPSIAAACVLVMLFGDAAVSTYLGLF